MKASEQLSIQSNVEDTDKQHSSNEGELTTNEQIENTPFYIRGNEALGYFLTMGDTRITELYEDELSARLQIDHTNWNFTTTVMATIIEKILNQMQIDMQAKAIEQLKATGAEHKIYKNEQRGGNL